jgi:hypothetical protein
MLAIKVSETVFLTGETAVRISLSGADKVATFSVMATDALTVLRNLLIIVVAANVYFKFNQPNLFLRRTSMSIKNLSIALASVLVMAAGIPAFAGTDNTSGTSQINTQSNVITGRNNTATNNSTQRATTSQSGRRSTNEAATVQDSKQDNDIVGKGNRATNNSTQRSNTRQSR